jgi:AcrR family transcriptional regulator
LAQPAPDNDSPQRRRGNGLELALFTAALAELRAVGYRKLTFDGVAARAGTSKAVLYRRWNTRRELVIAALRSVKPDLPGPAPDTGSLRGDVIANFGHIDESRGALPLDIGLGLLTDTQGDAKLHEYFLRRIRQASVDILMPALQRAESRGEIPTAALPERIITLPFDLARLEIVMTGKPPTKAAIVQIVDELYLLLLKTAG